MILHISKHIFSIGDKYDILDDQGNLVYKVIGQAFTIGHKLELHDAHGNELAKVNQRLFTFAPTYEIEANGKTVATVCKEPFTLTQPRYAVDGPETRYEMVGDWINWEFTITADGVPVAQVNKQFAVLADKYNLLVMDGADVSAIVCLVIIMDEVVHRAHRSTC